MPEIDEKRIIDVTIGFNANDETIEYINSDFMNEKYGFKDPIGYTAKLIQMGLEHWIRKEIGIFCPECDSEIKEDWKYCPECGWSMENDEE